MKVLLCLLTACTCTHSHNCTHTHTYICTHKVPLELLYFCCEPSTFYININIFPTCYLCNCAHFLWINIYFHLLKVLYRAGEMAQQLGELDFTKDLSSVHSIQVRHFTQLPVPSYLRDPMLSSGLYKHKPACHHPHNTHTHIHSQIHIHTHTHLHRQTQERSKSYNNNINNNNISNKFK